MLARTLSTLAASVLFLTAPALSQPEARSITVGFADLDLGSDAGKAQLDRRIRAAAVEVCGPADREMKLRLSFETCRNGAMADTNRRIAALGKGKQEIQIAARSVR